ncbi:MAG: hypothetical protein ACLQBD_32865 [Syntrophobacteraceae bacterium]
MQRIIIVRQGEDSCYSVKLTGTQALDRPFSGGPLDRIAGRYS